MLFTCLVNFPIYVVCFIRDIIFMLIVAIYLSFFFFFKHVHCLLASWKRILGDDLMIQEGGSVKAIGGIAQIPVSETVTNGYIYS